MKYIPQLLIIFTLSALGELLHALLPLPIPASIYGMVLLFAALALGILKPSQVRDVGTNLASLLPLLFVVPVVGLLDCWDRIRENLVPILVVLVVSTIVCFAVSGWITQYFIPRGGKDHD